MTSRRILPQCTYVTHLVRLMSTALFTQEREEREEIEKEFARYWNDPSCLDLFADWIKINAQLEMEKLARTYVRNCTKCGRQTTVKNFVVKRNMPPKCKDCLHVK